MADTKKSPFSKEELDEFLNGRYRDTDRVASSPGEYLDSVFGAPARTGIQELQKGNFNLDTLKKMFQQTGKDPRNAPTGVDIAMEATDNPYAGAALATAVDVGANLPGMGAIGPSAGGIAGKIDNLKMKPPVMSNPKVAKIADEYMQQRGLATSVPNVPAEVNPELSKKIAQAYEQMQHNPNDPAVKKAYDALIKETTEQYQTLRNKGLSVTRIEPGTPNPYKNSAELMRDIQDNQHMSYFPTESGFGSGSKVSDHPLLADTSELYKGEPMKANDLFRIVHDYFGHAKKGVGFGPVGEENAYRLHKEMFGPEAQKALATETRGQNSWVNFGPEGEANRLNPANTTYADQKAGILPDWAINQNEAGEAIAAAKKLPIARGPRISNQVESPVKILTNTPSKESVSAKLRSGPVQVSPSVAGSANFKKLMKLIKGK